MRKRSRCGPGLLAAAILALSGCTAAGAGPHSTLSPTARYVAMGSSFAAGAGIGPTKPGTPARCQRTALNYASLLAERLHLLLDDVTCGGATTAHVLGPWNELPPQIDAVTAGTRLVTITIGGNDLGYVGGLMAGGCRSLRPAGPCPEAKVPSDADYIQVERQLREIARQVRARAPQARLVFVQYLTLVPPQPCAEAALPPEFAAAGRATGERLAAITARVAGETGALVLAADALSRQHSPCSAEPWSIGMPPNLDRSRGAPWHPTIAGHAAIAQALAGQLGR